MAQTSGPPTIKTTGSGSKPLSSLPAMGTLAGIPPSSKNASNAEQDGVATKKKKKSLKGIGVENAKASVKKSVEASSLTAAVEQEGPSSSKDASGDNLPLDSADRESTTANVSAVEVTSESRKSIKKKDKPAIKGNVDVGAPLALTALPTGKTPKQKKSHDESGSAAKKKANDAPEVSANNAAEEETTGFLTEVEDKQPMQGETERSDMTGKVAEDDPTLEERPETELTEGGSYAGQWLGSTRHGKGKLIKPDGRTYEGSFQNGRVHGYGKFVAPNGTFEGQWLNDQAHGQGIYDHVDGSRYVGLWEYDKKSGAGVETWADGSHFKGQFSNGFKHGSGYYLAASGTSYDGQFSNDKMDGHGSYKFPDGRSHIGQFRDGHMNGSGSMEWPNGCKYTGSYQNDMKHGEGTFKWADGRAYHGQWQCGKQHGTGVLVKKDGQEIKAVWHEGKVVSSQEQMTQQQEVRNHLQNVRTSMVSTASSPRKKDSPDRAHGNLSDDSEDERSPRPGGLQNSRRANDLALIAAPKAGASRREDDLMLLTGRGWSQTQSSHLHGSKSGMSSLLQAQAPCFTPEGSESEDDLTPRSQSSKEAVANASPDSVDITFRPGPVNLTFLDGGIVKSAPAGGQASNAGVQPGWIIHKVNGVAINHEEKESINRLFVAVKASGKDYVVTFLKGDNSAQRPQDKAMPPQISKAKGEESKDMGSPKDSKIKTLIEETCKILDSTESKGEQHEPPINKNTTGHASTEHEQQAVAQADKQLAAKATLVNDEGAPVHLGTGRFVSKGQGDGTGKYYCGRKLGRAALPKSDGTCGPENGPQCKSCLRLQSLQAESMQGKESPRVVSAKQTATNPGTFAGALTESAIEVTLEFGQDEPKGKSPAQSHGGTGETGASKNSPGRKVSFAPQSNLLDAFQAAVDHVIQGSEDDQDGPPREAKGGSSIVKSKEHDQKVNDDADFAAGGRRKEQEEKMDKSLPPICLQEVQQWLLQVEIDPEVLRPLREERVPTGSGFGCLPGRSASRSRADVPKLRKDLVPDKDFVLYLSEAEVDFGHTAQWRMLKALHAGLTRSKTCPFTGPHWLALGFQNQDPRIDFRKKCGMLNLVHMFFFFSLHFETLKSMYWLAVNNASGSPYPLATVSMRITWMVVHALLSGHLSQFCNTASRAEDEGVFQSTCKLHAAAFYRFYKLWQLPRKRDLEQALTDIFTVVQRCPAKLISEFEKDLEYEREEPIQTGLPSISAPKTPSRTPNESGESGLSRSGSGLSRSLQVK